MKKHLFLFAAAAVALASCSSDDTIAESSSALGSQPKQIALAPIAQKPTRSTTSSLAIEGSVFPTTLDMMVTAYEATDGQKRDFFGATNFKYNFAGGALSTSGYWAGETARYWPLSAAYINFLAIANANDDNASSVTWGDGGTTNYAKQVQVVMGDNYAYNTKQHDFMYARGNGEVQFANNALTIPENVPMEFKHAQAYMIFRLKAADAASTAIKISDVSIYGAHFAGTALISQTNFDEISSQALTLYWNPVTQTNADKSVLSNQTPAATEGAATALTQNFVQMGQIMVVPHMSSADTYDAGAWTSFKIKYYLDGKEYSYVYTPTSTVLEANKKYIFDITFKLHEIFVDPTIDDWNEAGTTIVDIPTVVATAGAGSTMTYNISSLAKHYNAQASGFTGTETVTYALTTDGGIFATAPATGSAAAGVFSYNFITSANTSGATKTNVFTLTGAAGNKTTITLNQYTGYAYSKGASAGTFNVVASTEATYTFQVTGLTPYASFTVAKTDANSIITTAPTSVAADTDGVATITVTVDGTNSTTGRSAVFTLTNSTNAEETTNVTVAVP